MYFYHLFGHTVSSPIPLGPFAARKITRGLGDFHLTVVEAHRRPRAKEQPHWFHHVCAPNGERAMSFAKNGDGFLVRLHGVADFVLSGGGRWVRCLPEPRAHPGVVEALFLSQIMPLALSLKGFVALHACAVQIGNACAVMIGPQGAGKSTLAAAFVAEGHAILSDDVVPIRCGREKITVFPSVPEIRLCPGKVASALRHDPRVGKTTRVLHKIRADVGLAFCRGPKPLKAIYWLDPNAAAARIQIETASRREGWQALLENCFRLDLGGDDRMRQEFHALSVIAARVGVRRLRYPRRARDLPRVVAAVQIDFQD